ncbi:MAG: substrate-binding domain-containing protein [Clostridiales bacterium]|nr:substrate-binding domain-containing protein [Clostridiales bacterium]
MKYKLTALFLTLAVFAAGCGSETETAVESTGRYNPNSQDDEEEVFISQDPDNRPNIAICLPEENSYTKKLATELTNKLWVAGGNIILRYAENDSDIQAEQAKELFEQDIAGFVYCPVDGADLNIDSLNEKDIPVINIDVLDPYTECTDFYIAYDNVKIGEDIADYIVSTKELSVSKDVTIEFLFGENTSVTEDIYEGLMNGLSEYFDSGALVCRSGRTDLESCTTTAKTAVEVLNDLGRYLSGYYLNNDLQVCVTGSDYIASGCNAYFLSNGYTIDIFPVVTGVNGEASAVRDFEQGFLSMTSFKDASNEAEICAKAMSALVNRKSVGNIAETKTLNGDNKIPSVILNGKIVTEANYSEELVNGSYYTDKEIYG